MDGDERLIENYEGCPFCGAQIIKGRSICSNCGKNLFGSSMSKHEKEFNDAVADYF